MIKTIRIKSFKSIEDVSIDIGNLNVFIGANGSGKSNLLEAIGVLSAAAGGKVNDGTLLTRGVRPGLPRLYKSSFLNEAAPQHIALQAIAQNSEYSVSLHNPLEAPEPDWMYKHEKWSEISGTKQKTIVSRSPRKATQKFLGLAALKAVDSKVTDSAYLFLKSLQDYRIFTPTTSVLRGIANETQPRKPFGLSGGGLPEAVKEFLKNRKDDPLIKKISKDFFSLIDWAESYGACPSSAMSLSPSAAASSNVIRFKDKYMAENRKVISGYDASEGALFVLFLGILFASPASPDFFAIDNADYGLNPGTALAIFDRLSSWVEDSSASRQLLLTTHNPLVLDGLHLNNDKIRLFTVERNSSGKTEVRRITITEDLLKLNKEKDWPISRMWTAGYLGGIFKHV